MAESEPEAVVRRWFEQALSVGDLDVVEAIIAPGHVDHGLVELRGVEAVQRYVAAMRIPYPDIAFVIEDTVRQDDKVAVRWTATATHGGVYSSALLGPIPATGRRLVWSGMSIFRIVGGQIQESWNSFDQLRVLQQIIGRVNGPA